MNYEIVNLEDKAIVGVRTITSNQALVVIDIQNDITKNYKEIIGNINNAIGLAAKSKIDVVYIKHHNLSEGTRTFKPNTRGSELVEDMKVVSQHIFTKTKGNALTSEEFANFIEKNNIKEFFVAGADAIGCVKSTVFNMTKEGYIVNVLTDCITSYDKRKIPEMLSYYESRGCKIMSSCCAFGYIEEDAIHSNKK